MNLYDTYDSTITVPILASKIRTNCPNHNDHAPPENKYPVEPFFLSDLFLLGPTI